MLNLVFFFPAPIILALLLNELRVNSYKRVVQTFIYVPHFMSWVIIASITYIFFTTSGGVVNDIVSQIYGKNIDFLSSPDWFRPLIMMQIIWKETGWGTVIFLAALTAVDKEHHAPGHPLPGHYYPGERVVGLGHVAPAYGGKRMQGLARGPRSRPAPRGTVPVACSPAE